MKLTVVIMTTFLMQVSAAGFAQKVTLKEKSASLESVIKKIRIQTGYNFLFDSTVLEDTKKVDIQVNNMELEEALNLLFKNQKLSYSIKDGSVVIKPKTPSFLESVIARITAIDVSGRVVDAETGEPLPGATVKVKGKSLMTKTNNEGEFRLVNVEEDAAIEISYIGYVAVEVAAAKMMGVIKLKIGSSDLQEVTVNKGYYKVSEKLNTGSVVKIIAEVMEKQPVVDPLLVLQGRVTGMAISQSSGMPGASVNVRIRGQNSIANGNEPLYLINGVPFPSVSPTNFQVGAAISVSPLSFINAAEIESIEVLKDADATALYGSRGANGVVLITTKKGRAGSTRFNADISSGVTEIPNRLNLLNTREYLDMRYEAFKNDGVDWKSPSVFAPDLKTWDTTRYTNWQKVLLGGRGSILNAQISQSGGTENTQYSMSGGYNKTSSPFSGDFKYRTFSGLLSISHQSTDRRFKSTLQTRYLINSNVVPQTDPTSNIFLPPNAPMIYDANGKLNWENNTWVNPLAESLKVSTYNSTSNSTDFSASYLLFNGFELKMNMGYGSDLTKQKLIVPLTATSSIRTTARIHNATYVESKRWIIEPQITYNIKTGVGQFQGFVGASLQENTSSSTGLFTRGYPTDQLIENLAIAESTRTTTGSGFYRRSSILAQINYNIKDKYILNFTGSREGSTKFASQRRFGNFGAIGVAWVFSEEKYIEKLKFISYGKIRASYGVTGNDQMPDYEYLSSYTSYGNLYLGLRPFYPTRISNTDYAWEEIKKAEVGLEIGIFKSCVHLGLNFYQNRTVNQLVGYSLPTVAGFTSVRANLPAILQNSGIEAEITLDIFKKKSFKWVASANITLPRNKLVSYPNLESSSYKYYYAVGEPLKLLPLFNFLGLDTQTGLYTLEDINKDGAITDLVDTRLSGAKQIYFGGITNAFSYKSFQLDMFWQFVKQKDFVVYPGTQPGGMSNQLESALNRWQKPGDNSLFQKFSNGDFTTIMAYINTLTTTSNATLNTTPSFARLRNISLSYLLPDKIIKATKMQQCKFYLNVQNLLTITRYPGLDPETRRFFAPPYRTISAGVKLIF